MMLTWVKKNTLNQFVAYNEVDRTSRTIWIPDDIMYAPIKLGSLYMIKVKKLFSMLSKIAR